jgi:hypothetical protein
MTLKIERVCAETFTTLRLVGHLQSENLQTLQEQMRSSGTSVALDLEELTLVDVDAVRFLATSESDGVTLFNCAGYVREWIQRERDGSTGKE